MTRKNKPGHSGGSAKEAAGHGGRCREALAALANGNFKNWRGLPDRCTRADVEDVLSPVTTGVNKSKPYSGPLGYGPTPGAPNGLTVHYDAGTVDYVTIAGPQFEEPIEAILGEPEDKIESC